VFKSTRLACAIALATVLVVSGAGQTFAQAPGGGGGGGGARAPMTPLAYRQGIMQEFQTNMGAVNAVRAGQVGTTNHLVARATILQALATMLPEAFPEGSAAAPSRALPEIWANPGQFSQRIQAIQAATTALVEAARAGDEAAFASAQMAVQQSCAGCHMQFRGPAQ
jgi:cytochrome c556